MKGQGLKAFGVISLLAAAALSGMAQTNMPEQAPPQRGTASPGTVNYVEGQVTVDGQTITNRVTTPPIVDPNQVIDTGEGYAEVLLTPGAFLRIGHNSQVRLISAGLANVDFELNRGSAMVEADEVVKGARLDVVMHGGTTQIVEKGLYSFDAGQPAVRVLDGKARVSATSGQVTTLGKHNQLVLADNPKLKKTDFNSRAAETEPLYVWSKVRSESESQANVHVAYTVAAGAPWYGPGWYWDPLWADYAFIPGAGFLGGPFGWGFYSPGFVYAAPYGYFGGYYGRGYYGHQYYGRPNVAGVRTGVRSYSGPAIHSGFQGGGFHGAAGGGFHGGGGHR